jgi:NADH dehydrogenase FAD-containing subunit
MKRLLMIGAGHAHAQILRQWATAPRKDYELVVISPSPLAPYSGMVPGWLSGQYRYEEIVIDFAKLSARAGARWVCGELSEINPHGQQLRLSTGESLDYDCLSLNVGSTLEPPFGQFRAKFLSMRPIAMLWQNYEQLLMQWQTESRDKDLRLLAVGGGAAGFESMLAVMHRLRVERPDCKVQGTLITDGEMLPGYPRGARLAALCALRRAAIDTRPHTPWNEGFADEFDWVLWAPGGLSHAWQRDACRRGGLAVCEKGYIRVDPYLRSISHPNIFAVGDCASWHRALPKAGVFAVRMGTTLLYNLHAACSGKRLRTYRPQASFLSILNTSDGRAIGSRGSWSASGHWVWRLKNWIDKRFVHDFK